MVRTVNSWPKIYPTVAGIRERSIVQLRQEKNVDTKFTKETKRASAVSFVTRAVIDPVFRVPCVRDRGGFADTATERLENEFGKGLGKPKLPTCGDCKSTNYCSAECQREDRKKHKPTCKN